MLYVFHGSNISAILKKASTLVTSLRTKRPDATYVRIEAEQWSRSMIEEHVGGQGLFSNKYIILLDRVTENVEAKEMLVDFVATMNESANIFIVVEGKIGVELKRAFEKNAEKVVEINGEGNLFNRDGGKEKSKDFNIFALADAVGERNLFKAWFIYRQAIDRGIEPENIVGTLFWQLKSMKLASSAKSAIEAGLSPFVFTKSKKYADNYSKDELDKLIESLVVGYHDGHRGEIDMEISMERVFLNLK